MSSRVGYVIDRNQSGVWVKFDKDCASCRSCGGHSSGWHSSGGHSSGKQSHGRLPDEIIHLSRSIVGSSETNSYHLKRQLIGNRIENLGCYRVDVGHASGAERRYDGTARYLQPKCVTRMDAAERRLEISGKATFDRLATADDRCDVWRFYDHEMVVHSPPRRI